MIGNLLNSVMDYLATSQTQGNQRTIIENEYQNRKKSYNRKLNEAKSLFDRNYYRTYMDGVEERKIMERAQEQLRERTRAMYNTSVVTGDNSGAVGMLHRSNNNAMKQVETTLAENDNVQRRQAKNQYENSYRSLTDYIQEAKIDRGAKNYALSRSKDNNYMTLLRPFSNYVGQHFNSGLSQWLYGK